MNEYEIIEDKNIKSYCIKDDKIIVKYFDFNKKDIFLYNEDIELDLIDKIEEELLKDKNYKLKSKHNIKQSFVWFSFFGLFSFSAASSLVRTNSFFMWISLSVTCFVSVLNGWDVIREIGNIKNFNEMSNYINDRKIILEKCKSNDKMKQNNAQPDYSNNCVLSNNKSNVKKLILKK